MRSSLRNKEIGRKERWPAPNPGTCGKALQNADGGIKSTYVCVRDRVHRSD